MIYLYNNKRINILDDRISLFAAGLICDLHIYHNITGKKVLK
jgi:hypothetical protein